MNKSSYPQPPLYIPKKVEPLSGSKHESDTQKKIVMEAAILDITPIEIAQAMEKPAKHGEL